MVKIGAKFLGNISLRWGVEGTECLISQTHNFIQNAENSNRSKGFTRLDILFSFKHISKAYFPENIDHIQKIS